MKKTGLLNVPVSGRNDGESVIVGLRNDDEESIKKSRKSKNQKLSKSQKSEKKKLAKYKKSSKSRNLPKFNAKKAKPSFLISNPKTAFNYL